MKKRVCLSAILLINIIANSQIAYYAAKGIHDNCIEVTGNSFRFKGDANSLEKLSAYLKFFLPDDIRNTKLIGDQVFDHYTDNPFFGEQIKALSGGSSGFFSKIISNASSSIGGLDVTNIANGIAQFMIKRAKEELTVAFFNRFKKFAKENPEFEVLFPKTTDNLENLLAYKYPDMLPALRTGFFDDLKSITYHLDDVLELPRYQELLKNFPEIRVAIRSIRLVHEIESGDSHAADVLTKFAAFKEWKETSASRGFKNFGSSVKLAAIFSNSLRNDTSVSHSPRAWITFKQLDTLVTNDTIFRIYLGLVYQLVKNESIWFYTIDQNQDTVIVKFDSIMATQKENLFLFQNKVTEFIELANKVDKVLDTLNEKKSQSIALTNDDYYDYIDVSLNVIEYGFSIGKLFNENLKIDEYTKIGRKSNDLYRNIYKKEYAQAVSNAVDILTSIRKMIENSKKELENSVNARFGHDLEKPSERKIDSIFSKHVSLSKADTVMLNKTRALIESKSYFDNLGNILEKITRYGLFMSNMVNAETPEQVSAVLENAALPVGSSSIKKNSSFNISVQSYLGAYWRVGSLKYDNNNTWSNRWGVVAPIGVAFSYGLKKGGSISLFGSLLDIGAIVDFQLKKDSVATSSGGDSAVLNKDYKVKLGQIFSPGAYLVYGLPLNIPLSIGFGGQYGPGLGKIETNGNTIVNNPQWRWNIFLAVDIPFFNLVNSPKKYKP